MENFTRIYRFIILLIVGLAEVFAAFLMAFRPKTFLHSTNFQLVQLAHAFAVGALVVALLSFLLLRFRTREISMVGCGLLAIYNLGIGVTQGIMNYSGFALTAVLFHGFLSLSLVFLTVRARQQKP